MCLFSGNRGCLSDIYGHPSTSTASKFPCNMFGGLPGISAHALILLELHLVICVHLVSPLSRDGILITR